MDRQLEYASAKSVFTHEGIARKLVAEFKFGGQPVLGRIMAELAAPDFVDYTSAISSPSRLLISWVPSHKASERERGYNQAEILARRLVEYLPAASCAGLAAKVRETKHQKGLGRADRSGNLRDAFLPVPHLGMHAGMGRIGAGGPYSAVVVVDDVYTTGATAAAVSSVIGSATGLPVHFFTFSRAVSGRGEGHD